MSLLKIIIAFFIENSDINNKNYDEVKFEFYVNLFKKNIELSIFSNNKSLVFF